MLRFKNELDEVFFDVANLLHRSLYKQYGNCPWFSHSEMRLDKSGVLCFYIYVKSEPDVSIRSHRGIRVRIYEASNLR